MLTEQLTDRLKERKIEYRPGYALSGCGTFRIGGPADLWIQPSGTEAFIEAARICREEGCPVTVIGNGSNSLFPDEGIRGAVIGTKGLRDLIVQGGELRAGAGVMLPRLALEARNAGLAGLNFLSGIPGTVGGATAMNAGCYGSSMGSVLDRALVMDLSDGHTEIWTARKFGFGERDSVLLHDPSIVVLEVFFRLLPGDRKALFEEAEQMQKKRAGSQPLEDPSAGSVFKRHGAEAVSRLIDLCGLKGTRVGGAEVSPKHAGFIVNRGQATAEDVKALIRIIQDRVKAEYGFVPEPEIRIFPPEGGR